jgi:Fe-S cluster biogenesis protein NfuA
MAKVQIRRQRPAADIEAQIRSEIESITPLLGLEHCVIHLSRFAAEDGVAVLRVDASCSDCGVSAETFFAGIETRLKVRIAEVREVRMQAEPE